MSNKRIVVYIPGCWDILHVGHLNVLKRAAQYGDILAVGVESDRLIEEEKGDPPAMDLLSRVQMLEALEIVSFTVPYHTMDYVAQLKKLDADVLVFGPTHNKKRHEDAKKYITDKGGRVVILPRTEDISSSELREKGV